MVPDQRVGPKHHPSPSQQRNGPDLQRHRGGGGLGGMKHIGQEEG